MDGLRTARLSLRAVMPCDAGVMTGFLQNKDVSRWLTGLPFPFGIGDAVTFIARATTERARVWMIEDASGCIGQIGIGAELGYWLSPRVWGRGYATEAASAAVQAYFLSGGEDLFAGVHPDNHASTKVLTKLGFEVVGFAPEVFGASDTVVNRNIYSLRAMKWHGLRHAAE